MNAREVARQARNQLLDLAEKLGSRRAAAEKLSACGLSSSWLLKFLNGQISNPTIESVATLQAALAKLDNEPDQKREVA